MKSEIESYIVLLQHEMFAENIKTVDKGYITEVVLRAGGEESQVEEILNHPWVNMGVNGEYTVHGT